ncbi:NADPH-dependent F420 reductase [Nocardia thailandica]|uniref:NADPH-dependent F420 reductase n=1 Tax=Nocardia thailandica TaxID=257275 RepID=A0ABW6PPT3_9NOCA|nr:NAD(P)-binding domain-containing protein [Nocardia thailandica]
MATIGLIGSGHIGSTVAKLAVDAGYDVVLSNSRGPETLTQLVAELGPRARAATPAEAAAAGDYVVVTVPLKAYRDVPVAPLAGKVVFDTNNYYPDRDGAFPELDNDTVTTSQLLQHHLPEAKVVKAFNNIVYANLGELARPAGAADRSALPIFGDDAEAKKAAAEVIDALGYDVVDGGTLAESRRSQRDTPVYVHPYAVADGNWPPAAKPAGVEAVRAALAAAEV